VGSGRGADEIIKSIAAHPELGITILGCLETDRCRVGTTLENGAEVIASLDEFEYIARDKVVDEIVFSLPLKHIPNVSETIRQAQEFGIRVRLLPQWHMNAIDYIPPMGSIHFDTIAGLHTMMLATGPRENRQLLVKGVLDYVLAAVMLVLSLPFNALIVVAIKASSRGPVLYQQERLSTSGRRFILYKFRTMVIDADQQRDSLLDVNESDGPAFKIEKDPRIIPVVGTFLRRTGLDELPQLINILKGEMSLVGPRPPLPLEVEKYEPWQRRRLSMKPGLTGPWQISPRRHQISFQEWMKMDLQYIDHWSLGLDAKILLKTVWASLSLTGR
jgi:exopolysaccharide biosynthesis polyprenyl glycosylphosphotransferase